MQAVSKISCPRSNEGHVGFHILKKKGVTGEVCGFCGLSTCVSKSKLVASNKSKGQQYYKLESTCPYFYSYGRKPEFSKRNKCSNHLARCQAVGCSADVWKYHMAGHYEQSHPQLAIPEAFVVSNAEKEAISVYDK